MVPAFDNVEVYRLLAHLLELDRLAPNNGTEAVTQRVLGHKTDDGESQQRSAPVWPEPRNWSVGETAVLVDPQLRVSWQLPAGSAEPSAGLERAVERFRAAAFPHRTAGNLPRLERFRCYLNRRRVLAAPVQNKVGRPVPPGPGGCGSQ